MKKLILVAIILMTGVSVATAQKGAKSVGLNLNYGSEIGTLGMGAKFQYGITDEIRVEPSFNSYLEKSGVRMWDLGVNFHYLFDVKELFNTDEPIKIYPLLGIGYAHVKSSWGLSGGNDGTGGDDWTDGSGDNNGEDWYPGDDGWGRSLSNAKASAVSVSTCSGNIAINLGIGAEYQLSEKIAVGAELKYQIISNFNQFVFGIGFTYKL